jgi:hypothetical protein
MMTTPQRLTPPPSFPCSALEKCPTPPPEAAPAASEPPGRSQQRHLHHIRPADIFISIDSPQSESTASSSASAASCVSLNSLMAATAAITPSAKTTTTATEENISSCKPLVAATALAFYDDDDYDDDCFCSDKSCEVSSAVGLAETAAAAERPLLRAGDVMRTAGRWQQSMGFSLDLDCNVNNILHNTHTYSTFQYTDRYL